MPAPRPLLRVPYTDPFPPPRIIPSSASTPLGAIEALVRFLAPSLPNSRSSPRGTYHQRLRDVESEEQPIGPSTVILTGAGISVASGLADYRGTHGTYTRNRSYRPIYYHEFCTSHESRKRYWARSFLGWPNLSHARPNAAHYAIGRLGPPSPSSQGLGIVHHVITQNVDSFHPTAHPSLPTTELHGHLRTVTCLSCGTEYPRSSFQQDLRRLNPTWAAFLDEMLAEGALATSNDPSKREKSRLKKNPDGDVDVPGAEYSSFRYPPCPTCLLSSSSLSSSSPSNPSFSSPSDTETEAESPLHIDQDGAYVPPPPSKTTPTTKKGILKPSVTMFAESISPRRKTAADQAVDEASRILVLGTSLATYSAWRLVRRARDRGLPVAILNLGGCRGEEGFFAGVGRGEDGVRVDFAVGEVLPRVVEELERLREG